jgi:hypothetical protein
MSDSVFVALDPLQEADDFLQRPCAKNLVEGIVPVDPD